MDINIKSCQITTPPLPSPSSFLIKTAILMATTVYGTISKEANPRTDYCMFSLLALTGI